MVFMTRRQSGTPVLKELDWLNWKPNGGHLFFAPITPTNGKDARIVHEIVTRLHLKWGFDSFPTWYVLDIISFFFSSVTILNTF